MIDAHVHAFPPALPGAVLAAAQRIGRAVARVLPRRPLVDIERAAALQHRLGRYHTHVERAATVAMVPQVVLGGTVDGLVAAMDRHGASRCLLIGARGVAHNDWLLGEAVRRGGDRFVPVATMPELPADAPARAWADAYAALARRGARGFKIHGNWDDVDASHPAIGALFEVAAATGRFVILHTGCFHVPGYKRSAACDLGSYERWFAAFPEVKVCLAHMNRERPEDAWAVMRRHAQVFADTSWQPTRHIARAVDAVGAERVMVGSDWPLLHPGLIGDARARAERAVTGAALDELLERSARRFLGELS